MGWMIIKMYKLSIKPKYKEVEMMMYKLIEMPVLIVKDNAKIRSLGIQAKSLRDVGLLHISQDPKLRETTCILKCSNYYIPGNAKKIKRRNCSIDYTFDMTNMIKLPKI